MGQMGTTNHDNEAKSTKTTRACEVVFANYVKAYRENVGELIDVARQVESALDVNPNASAARDLAIMQMAAAKLLQESGDEQYAAAFFSAALPHVRISCELDSGIRVVAVKLAEIIRLG